VALLKYEGGLGGAIMSLLLRSPGRKTLYRQLDQLQIGKKMLQFILGHFASLDLYVMLMLFHSCLAADGLTLL
jgi:hypothetical protein